jgi:Ca2+-binding RTX toxin-like protein
MMRKIAIALAVGVLFLLLSAGVVFAVTKICDQSTCVGTSGNDNLTGTAIDNTITGRDGNDTINDTQGADRDTIRGNKGNDTIDVREGNNGSNNKDFVNCGPGKDTVFKDANDDVVNCERVNPGV